MTEDSMNGSLNDSLHDPLNGGTAAVKHALERLEHAFPEDVAWARQSAQAMTHAMRELDAWQWPERADAAR